MNINHRLLFEASHEKNKIILSIGLGLAGGILAIFQAFYLSKIIDQVFLQNGTLLSVSALIAVIIFIVTIRAGVHYLGEITASSAAQAIKGNVRRKLFTHIYALGPSFLRGSNGGEGTQTGELVNLATEGADTLDAYFSQYVPQLALAVLVPISILLIVFPTDPLSGIILLLTAPLLPIFMYLIGHAADTLTRKQWLGLSRMSAYFLDVLQGLTTLKTLGRSKDQVKIVEKVSDQYRQSTMGVLRITFLSALVLELVGTLSTAVIAVEIGIRLLYGKLAFEQAFFILLLAPEFYLPLRTLGVRFHASMAGVEAAKNIFKIVDIPSDDKHRKDSEILQSPPLGRHPPPIAIKNLSFSYPDRPPTLDNISLEIPAGKITAILGESGAGKTTLVWLLLRFLQAQSGEILINGSALEEIPISQWYADLAWVPQNPYLFDDSIAANIRLARPAADFATVEQAARLAHADEFIHQLPQGYETRVGEHGVRLSGGQAQRIALARAFIKDAPLLILDEATSHLDPLTDAQLQDSIQQLVKNRTVIVIAHRKTTLAAADQVFEISRGRIDQSAHVQAARMILPSEQKISQYNERFSHPISKPISDRSTTVEQKRQHKTKSFARLFNLLAPFWSRILLSVFLGFATIASGIGLMATSAYIISAAALHPSIAELEVAIVGVRFFGLARGVFRYLERLVSHDVTFRLLASWRVRFYQALEPLAPARLFRYHSGELLARVIRDIGTLENFYVRTVNPPLVALLVSTAALLFLGGFGKSLAWSLLLFLVLAGIILPLLAGILTRRIGSSLVLERGKFNTLLVDSLQGLPDLLTSGRGNSQLSVINQAGEKLSHLQDQMSGIASLHNAFGSLVASLGMVTVLVLAIELVSRGQLDAVLLGVVTLTALTCFEAMQPLPQVVQNLESNQAASQRLYELVDAPNPIEDPASPKALPRDVSLRVQNLAFAYPPVHDLASFDHPPPFTLQDISFSLAPGKHIALLGPSGSGKTTLVNLLLRFWEYQFGSIRLGKDDYHNYHQADIRSLMTAISQDTYLFCATIKDNLLIARPTARMEDLQQAIKQAQLEHFIQSLPAGYDTWIGEHGLRLSAGERQRLALARAFLRDTPLLILDEPTTNLDPVNEKALLATINHISQGKCVLYITQNMVGLESMDEIIVLHNGLIIERGNHSQLLHQDGMYARMWSLYHQIV